MVIGLRKFFFDKKNFQPYHIKKKSIFAAWYIRYCILCEKYIKTNKLEYKLN